MPICVSSVRLLWQTAVIWLTPWNVLQTDWLSPPTPPTHMKTTTLRASALMFVAAMANAPAFTLDFASLSLGTNVPNMPSSLVLNVAGYGDIAFSSGNASHLEIVTMDGSSGPTKSINMNGGETLIVTFQGATPFDVNFGFEEVDSGEIMTSMAPFSPTQYIVSMNGTNAGVSAVNFQVVPEPSAILLGGLGSLLLFRRRRA